MTRTTDLMPLLKRLQLGPMAATLPERIALARREQLDYTSFLQIILSDEVNRRAHRRIEVRLHSAGFEQTCRLEDFDWSASITLFRRTKAEERVMPAEVKVLGWSKGVRSGMVVRGAGRGTVRTGGRVPWGADVEYAYRAGYDGRGRVSVTHVVERGYSAMLTQPEPVAA